ncbi:MAG: DUF4124 domain-containing protein [Thermodesulfobacteriota bacterium]
MKKIKPGLKRAVRLLIICLGIALPISGAAEVYKYIDDKGVTHFTDRFESIPAKYRPQIQIIKEQPTSPILPPASEPTKEKVEESEKTQPQKIAPPLGKGEIIPSAKEEEKLKVREEKEKRIAELEQQIEEKRKQQRSLRTNWMVYDRYAIIRLNQEIENLEKQIKVLQRELEEER